MNKKIIENLIKDTNNSSYIVYRKKIINNKEIIIIYNEVLISSNSVSDFIIKSLDDIEKTDKKKNNLYMTIKNNINNFKVKDINSYEEVCNYLNNGFVILLIEEYQKIALEVKKNLSRSIDKPLTERTLRGSMDSFNENIETNIGLIKRRIKTNNLWNKDFYLGKYSKTKLSLLYINGIVKDEIINKISNIINNINIDSVIDSGTLKNLLTEEHKSVFPTIMTTERPDKVCDSLLMGKIILILDNSPFALILPVFFNDFFLSEDDKDYKYQNITLTRLLRYTAFFITIMTPALYIAITTFNQEMLPIEFLISFASQRNSVPFPAFFEALLMLLSFDILRESDLRIPNGSNSSLSIVGALILGEAAVNAGIVSPVMIIVEAITAISALIFTEPELSSTIKWYRILFMIGATTIGIYGVFLVFIYFITNISSINSFGKPFMIPYAPLSINGIKNSIIKFPLKKDNKRCKYLSNNIVKEVNNEKN